MMKIALACYFDVIDSTGGGIIQYALTNANDNGYHLI